MSTNSPEQKTLVDLLSDMHVGMLTTQDGDGGLRAVPMARQEVEPSADLWFISARDTDHVSDIAARPAVGLTFSSSDAWVSVQGTAEVVDDLDKLREMWNSFAEAWLPGGPEDDNATLLHVTVTGGEYWDTPGSKVATLISLAKTKLTGEPYDADHGTVDAS